MASESKSNPFEMPDSSPPETSVSNMSSAQENELASTAAHTTGPSDLEKKRSEAPGPSSIGIGALDMAPDHEETSRDGDAKNVVSDQENAPLETSDPSSVHTANSMVSERMETLTEPIGDGMASDSVNSLAGSTVHNMTSDQENTSIALDIGSMVSPHRTNHQDTQYAHDFSHAPRDPGLHPQTVVLTRLDTMSREVAQDLIDFATGETTQVRIPNLQVTYQDRQRDLRDDIGAVTALIQIERNDTHEMAAPAHRIIRTSPGYTAYIRRYLQAPINYNMAQNVDFHGCVFCFDESTEGLILLPCEHSICRICLNHHITSSTRIISQFPPRCCFHALDVEAVQEHLDPDVIEGFNAVVEQYSDRSQFFCANKYCSAYINTQRLQQAQGQFVKCHDCGQDTCKGCKQGADQHHCPAPNEQMSAADRELIEQRGYKRCPACGTLCEREDGCPKMPCVCGQSFCILCGRKWPVIGMCKCSPTQTMGGHRVRVRRNFRQPYIGNAARVATFADQHLRLTPEEQNRHRVMAQATREDASGGDLARSEARFYATINVPSPQRDRPPQATVPEQPAAEAGRDLRRQLQELPHRLQRLWQGDNSRGQRNSARSVPDELREAERNVQFWEDFFGNGARIAGNTPPRRPASNQPMARAPSARPVVSPPRPAPGLSANTFLNAYLNPRQAPMPPGDDNITITRPGTRERAIRSEGSPPDSAALAASDTRDHVHRFGWLRSFRSIYRLRDGTPGYFYANGLIATRRSHEEPPAARPQDLEADQQSRDPRASIFSRAFDRRP
ncbi:uncharacterized protein PV06_00429 [Exophiala oligosperma]|uniref:RING-type domain-containing protein n=1 Tax=Exophiala oligosperma TaxID=215243 RepID=A0A0D2B667_9EURO|nr:uncharacterized protein PV06_00429 [Exophiala oligosperma]KIW47766.1 hypothetical protein PV06_00429 [Exophiala oligosperma]